MADELLFPLAEVCDALLAINQVIVEELLHMPEVSGLYHATQSGDGRRAAQGARR